MRDDDVRSACFNALAVRRAQLEDEDGPMLDLLEGFHGAAIVVPRQRASAPDRDRLALRFERFLERG